MSPIDKASELFAQLSGVGPRQARRFVYQLLRNKPLTQNLSNSISHLGDITQCKLCTRFAPLERELCELCRDPSRINETLLITANDTDVTAIERLGLYQGRYFVLGRLIPVAGQAKLAPLFDELKKVVSFWENKGLQEIILGFGATPEGDNTADTLERELASKHLVISRFGRGFATGTEIAYADKQTFSSALGNRKANKSQ